MNHLLKVIKFYKLLKDNDILAINYYLNSFNEILFPSKAISTADFNIYFFEKEIDDTSCEHCFINLYKYTDIYYLPFQIGKNYFFIMPSIRQVFKNHIIINDFIHQKTKLDLINIMLEISMSFNSFMILYTHSNHNHFELGTIESPLLHLDAVNIKDEIYSLKWNCPAFLIKDSDIKTIDDNFENLKKEFKNIDPIVIFFKRNNKYYLYVVFNTTTLSSYEVLGIFISYNNLNSIHKEIDTIRKKTNARHSS